MDLYALYQQHPNVYIDHRNADPNGIFIAVGQKDERGYHRGNAFAQAALAERQAAYVVVNDRELYAAHAADPRWILVEDGEHALQELARTHRRHLNIPVLAVAGSNGKTTTRQLIELVLQQRYHVFATPGNLNNHLGLPLSILQIRPEHEIAVLEIGANHLRETYELASIAAPTCGLITNCGKDHLGEYGSLENIVRANSELFDVLAEQDGLGFVNYKDLLICALSRVLPKIFYYNKMEAIAGEITQSPMLGLQLSVFDESCAVQTQLFGSFWLNAVLAAAAVGAYFEVPLLDIKRGLESYTPRSLRSEWIEWRGHRVLLDCYNANPSSMEVFVQELHDSAAPGSVLVLGEMLELGEYSDEEHQQLIQSLQVDHFQYIILVGKSFLSIDLPTQPPFRHFATTAQAKEWLQAQPWQPTDFYVKGSRGNRLETLFDR